MATAEIIFRGMAHVCPRPHLLIQRTSRMDRASEKGRTSLRPNKIVHFRPLMIMPSGLRGVTQIPMWLQRAPRISISLIYGQDYSNSIVASVRSQLPYRNAPLTRNTSVAPLISSFVSNVRSSRLLLLDLEVIPGRGIESPSPKPRAGLDLF